MGTGAHQGIHHAGALSPELPFLKTDIVCHGPDYDRRRGSRFEEASTLTT
jgi:hypothetical protein